MASAGIYAFDEADAELSLLPMAARRALDCAGLHLSLKGWQALSVAERRALVRLGAAEVVDAGQVQRALGDPAISTEVRSEPPWMEPDAGSGPPVELLDKLPSGQTLSQQRWSRLSGLDRYVLCQLARRGKAERLARAWAEISGSGGAAH